MELQRGDKRLTLPANLVMNKGSKGESVVTKVWQGAFVGLIVGFIVTVLFGATFDLTGWVLLPGVILGAVIGALCVFVYVARVELKKYEKLIFFIRVFLNSRHLQDVVDSVLEDKAHSCARDHQRVINLQRNKITIEGVSGIKKVESMYDFNQKCFRESQGYFYETYDFAMEFGAMFGITFRERSWRSYLSEKSQDEISKMEQTPYSVVGLEVS